MDQLATEFTLESGIEVTLSTGSTGKHYAQIKHGAPFDVFFAADVERPQLLEETGAAVEGTRFTYALGKLVLWSANPGLVDQHAEVLTSDSFNYVAIANPDLAPYGSAAREVLKGLDLWDALNDRIVRGENINNTYQYVRSRNADLGFVAYSQIVDQGASTDGSKWIVPDSLYPPIEQQAILIRETEQAKQFITFVRSTTGRQIIRDSGYEVP